MDTFLKITAGVLVTVILTITLSKHEKEMTILLVTAVCCMVAATALSYIEPVIDFLQQLCQIGNLNSEMFRTLFKAVGIGLLSEIACTICTDSGNHSLSKVLQILTTSLILCISIPILSELMTLVDEILGAL